MTEGKPESSAVPPHDAPHTIVIHDRRSQTVWWLIGVSLAVIAVCMVLQLGDEGANRAHAQTVRSAGARGIFAFTGQLSKDGYGVFMVDVEAGTLWCYRYVTSQNVLKLVAARDWTYDRYLTDFATEPSTDYVKAQLEQQRAAALRGPVSTESPAPSP